MWAVGIILFELIFESHPFREHAESRETLTEAIRSFQVIEFPQSGKCSEQAKDLI